MRKVIAVMAALAVSSLAYAAPYTGASYTVVDIAGSDVPGPQPIRAFPVPAAANWSGAQLIYDNYAEGLGFSASQAREDFNWIGMPLSNADVTIYRLTGNVSSPARSSCTPGEQKYFTNAEGVSTDTTFVDDNRFPYKIPRPGHWCGQYFSQIQIVPTEATHRIGVFLPYHSNDWGQSTPTVMEDHNYQRQSNSYYLYVHGEGEDLEDWTVAEALGWASMKVSGTNSYCPFLMVDSNGADKIAALTIIHDVGSQGSPTFGFMDIYVPEPATMLLLATGGLLLVKRKRR
jgi:hypothetical protein